MSKFKIIRILDTVFKTSVVFLIAFAWINFYLENLWLVFLLSISITMLICYILNIFSVKKNAKKQNEASVLQQIEMSNMSMQLKTDSEKSKYIASLVKGDNKKIHTAYVSYTKNDINKIVTYYYKTSILDEYILLDIINKFLYKSDEIIVLCTQYTDKANKIASSIANHKISLLNKSETYFNLFSKNDCVPKSNLITEKATKFTFKDFWQKFSSKNNAKKFFLSGLLLLVVSIIIPYSVYYIVFGSLLMIFALICFVRGKRKSENTNIF